MSLGMYITGENEAKLDENWLNSFILSAEPLNNSPCEDCLKIHNTHHHIKINSNELCVLMPLDKDGDLPIDFNPFTISWLFNKQFLNVVINN
jgi:hypothetical protein